MPRRQATHDRRALRRRRRRRLDQCARGRVRRAGRAARSRRAWLRRRASAARSRGARLGGDLARRLRRRARGARRGGRRAERVAGLAFDATCSLALFDAAGRPVTVSTTGDDAWNVVMWADHRAVAEAAEITATGHRALDYVGGAMSPEMELPKLLWLKRHLPHAWERYGLALDLADFLTWRATGRVAVSACTVTCKWTLSQPRGAGLAGGPAGARRARRPAGARAAAAARNADRQRGRDADRGRGRTSSGSRRMRGRRRPDRRACRRTRAAWRLRACRPQRAAGDDRRHVDLPHGGVAGIRGRLPGVWGPYFGAMIPGLWLNEGGQSATGALLDHVLDWHAEGRNLGAAAARARARAHRRAARRRGCGDGARPRRAARLPRQPLAAGRPDGARRDPRPDARQLVRFAGAALLRDRGRRSRSAPGTSSTC